MLILIELKYNKLLIKVDFSSYLYYLSIFLYFKNYNNKEINNEIYNIIQIKLIKYYKNVIFLIILFKLNQYILIIVIF